jgi:hypothetical protein
LYPIERKIQEQDVYTPLAKNSELPGLYMLFHQ